LFVLPFLNQLSSSNWLLPSSFSSIAYLLLPESVRSVQCRIVAWFLPFVDKLLKHFCIFLPNCSKHSVVALYCNCHGVAQHPDCVGGEMEWWAIYLGCKLDAKAIFRLSPMRLQGCEETLNHDLYGRGIT